MRSLDKHLRAVIRPASILLCVAFFAFSFSTAFALDTSTRTEADIQARWHELMPVYSGSPYAVQPSTSAPYEAGSLTSGFLQDGVNAFNYCRYLAGLPDDVSIDSAYEDTAQHGAVLLVAAGFTHTPSKPADMSQSFYAIGYKATSSSNIGAGDDNLASFTFSCMDDSDTENIDRLGHRRWILNPPLLKTGMGYADLRSDTYAFDSSRIGAVSYDTVKWPCAGPFPVEMINPYTPWSITLNPSLYAVTSGTSGYKVTLRRRFDGKAWTFTSADTNKNGEYFNVETSRYGVPNCIIFRPDPSSVGGYRAGDVFDVTVSGPIKRLSDGKPATINYMTDFISQDGPATTLRLAGASSVRVKRTYKLSGRITPSSVSGKVRITLSRYAGGRWRSAGARTVALSGGHFRYVFKPGYRGKWRATARYGALATTTVSSKHSIATKGFAVK